MDIRHLPPLTITRADADRLDSLVTTYDMGPLRRTEILRFLNHELDRAVIVDPARVKRDVVTMNCQVRFRDEINGTTHDVTLVYPAGEDLDTGKLSVLSPAGSALLGLREGHTITWQLAANPWRSLTVLAVSRPAAPDGNRAS